MPRIKTAKTVAMKTKPSKGRAAIKVDKKGRRLIKSDVTGKLRRRGGPQPTLGSDEKMVELFDRAMALRIDGNEYSKIGIILAKEFGLPNIPCKGTVYGWCAKAVKMFSEMEGVKNMVVFETLEVARKLREKFMPIALEETLAVQRKRMLDGEVCYEVDEERFKEQAGAAKVVIDAQKLTLQAVGAGKSDIKEGDSGGDFYLTLIKSYQNVIHRGPDDPEDRNVLVMSSGDPEIDAIEAEALASKP